MERGEDQAGRQFTEAARTHGGAMFRAARAVLDSDADAEDAVGEAILHAWRSWDKLKDPSAVRTWLLKITVNCAYTQRRKLGRVAVVEDMEPYLGAAVDRPYEDLWEAVSALPPEERLAVTLFYYEDMTTDQIARTAGVSRGAVRSRLHRARARLKKLLGEGDGQ